MIDVRDDGHVAEAHGGLSVRVFEVGAPLAEMRRCNKGGRSCGCLMGVAGAEFNAVTTSPGRIT